MKGLMTFVILFLVLGLGFDVSIWNVLLLTLVLGGVSYLIGDLFILPKTSNMTATLSDLVMAFLVIWLLGMAVTTLTGSTIAMAAAIAAIIIAVGEFFFHEYIMARLGGNRRYRTRTDY